MGEVQAPVKAGDILGGGKYRVERVIGVGGMGVVVAATHLQLDQLVALKFLKAQLLENAEATSRFVREARATVKLRGEHVCKVLDVGTLDTGAPFIVMEYLEGTDLGALVEQQGPLSVDDAANYLLQACEALAEAHAAGIVHRDLKPENLFLTEGPDGRPFVKVMDFGVSKLSSAAKGAGGGSSGSDLSLTASTAIVGSPYYMSPEQLRSSKDVDARADIWSLGVVLYHLLTDAKPFPADSFAQLCVQILGEGFLPPSQLRPTLPPEADEIVGCCLEKDRERRYSDLAALAAALVPLAPKQEASLERVAGSLRVVPGRVRAATPVPRRLVTNSDLANNPNADTKALAFGNSATVMQGEVSGISTHVVPRKRRLWIFAASAVVVAMLAVGIIIVSSSRHPATHAAAPAIPDAGVRATVAPIPQHPDAGLPVVVPTVVAVPAPASSAAPSSSAPTKPATHIAFVQPPPHMPATSSKPKVKPPVTPPTSDDDDAFGSRK